MAGLRDQIVSFIAALRNGGVRISVAESIDAVNAVAVVGLERDRMREGLAAALIKDEADRAIFDESFERFFATTRAARGAHPDHRGEQVSAAAGRGKPGDNPSARDDDAPLRKTDEPREGAGAIQTRCRGASGATPMRATNLRRQASTLRASRDFARSSGGPSISIPFWTTTRRARRSRH